MEKGDEIICAIPGIEHLGLKQGEFYEVSEKGHGALEWLMGPVVSIKGFPSEVFFSEAMFVKVNKDKIDKILRDGRRK